MININASISNNDAFQQFAKQYIPKIDKTIKTFFKRKYKEAEYSFVKDMYPYLENFCLREGKRIRPLLFLVSYLGYKKSKKNFNDILKIASIIEMMHSFLLVQDDIIDNSELRRGEKTIHVLCQENYGNLTKNKNIGNDIALVLSDVLISNTIEIVSDVKIPEKLKSEFLKQYARTFELTAWGQVLDTMNSSLKEIDINSNNPELISTLKTAYYTLQSPLLMGHKMAGGQEKKEEECIRKFALPLGLAFQIRDDILGVFGSKEKIGKCSDSDIIEGKLTLLIQSTVKNLNKQDSRLFIKRFSKDKKSNDDINKIKSIIKASGALDQSNQKLNELIITSKKALEKLKIQKEEKKILSSLADLISVI